MVGRFKWIAVSNGKQTPDIAAQFKKGVIRGGRAGQRAADVGLRA